MTHLAQLSSEGGISRGSRGAGGKRKDISLCLSPRSTVVAVRLLIGSVPDAVVAKIAVNAAKPLSSLELRGAVQNLSLLIEHIAARPSSLRYLRIEVDHEPAGLTSEIQRASL